MMQKEPCAHHDALIDYLYGEGDSARRRTFEAHLTACADCASELAALQGTRAELTHWSPPEQVLGFRVVRDEPARRPWARVFTPAFGLAAAAALVLAAAAAVAQVEVRYGDGGLTMRTGWGRRAAVDAAQRAEPASRAARTVAAPSTSSGAPWRADLVALERQLRNEFTTAAPRTVTLERSPSAGAPTDQQVLRRVRTLIDESEQRQQRQLALRLSQVLRDVETQRRADLVRIQQGFGELEGITGAEAARQREMLNYLVRVSSQR